MEETIKRVKIAFRKLKASVLFDKTALPLRDAVVAFETSDGFEKELENISIAYCNGNLDKTDIMSKILTSVSVIPFPKKTRKIENRDDIVINIGNPKEEPIIEELQHYIDMDVRGHIIGILWIMAYGKRLDDCCYQNARGNRLRKSLIWNSENEEIKNSPALFEPYFAQYSLWRDGGLSCAEDLLANKHDVMMLTLDLKKYYYNAGITKEAFNEILDENDTPANKGLHEAVFSIILKYTEAMQENGIRHNGNVLPIGFLPSSILSNWCLAKFDQGILDLWNPAYYGRYVDDIIIVEKIEKGSEIYKKARERALEKDFVIDYYLGAGRRKGSPCFVERVPSRDASETLDSMKNSDANANDNGAVYRINKEFCLSNDTNLEFQSKKTRIIEMFSENNSSALEPIPVGCNFNLVRIQYLS